MKRNALTACPVEISGFGRMKRIFLYNGRGLFGRVSPYGEKACVLELGCGTGAISLLAANRGAQSVLAVDKNPHVIELLKRSVRENGLEQQVMPFVGDILAYREYLKPDTMDLVYMNPPYRIGGRRRQLMTEACHEVGVTLEDFIKAAAFALKTRGRLAMVQLPDRFTDALRLADRYHLEIKRLQWVHSYIDRGAWIFWRSFKRGPGRAYGPAAPYHVPA